MIPMGKTSPQIHFFSENILFRLYNIRIIRTWITDSILNENHVPGEINFIFCDDQYLFSLNREYLAHDTFTDIITFDLSDQEDMISGDIYISIERARENAVNFKVKFMKEVCRLIIHGILHLCGYNDKTHDEKQLMTTKEDYYLSLLPK